MEISFELIKNCGRRQLRAARGSIVDVFISLNFRNYMCGLSGGL